MKVFLHRTNPTQSEIDTAVIMTGLPRCRIEYIAIEEHRRTGERMIRYRRKMTLMERIKYALGKRVYIPEEMITL